MYKILKNVIANGKYELTSMLSKIDTIWVQGSITDDQHDELVTMAREHAKAENEIQLFSLVMELDVKVKVLEEKVKALETGETPVHPENPVEPFVVGKVYKTGDKVSFEGKVYECIAPEGAVCVWSPTDYPTYWNEVGVVEDNENSGDSNSEDSE